MRLTMLIFLKHFIIICIFIITEKIKPISKFKVSQLSKLRQFYTKNKYFIVFSYIMKYI